MRISVIADNGVSISIITLLSLYNTAFAYRQAQNKQTPVRVKGAPQIQPKAAARVHTLTRNTSSAFCFGVTRQQTQDTALMQSVRSSSRALASATFSVDPRTMTV